MTTPQLMNYRHKNDKSCQIINGHCSIQTVDMASFGSLFCSIFRLTIIACTMKPTCTTPKRATMIPKRLASKSLPSAEHGHHGHCQSQPSPSSLNNPIRKALIPATTSRLRRLHAANAQPNATKTTRAMAPLTKQ